MNNIAVVTGGRTGIGLAASENFQQHGFRVINISRQASALSGVINLEADFTVSGWQDLIQDQLRGHLEGADRVVVVHNAGLHVNDSTMKVGADGMRRSMEVNVIAPAILNTLVDPFLSPGSSIIYIGSTLSEKAVAGCAPYVVSKHAILGLMRSTCQDLRGRQVHTACICPGFTDTEMLREHVGESLEDILALCTFDRLVEPREIAECILFCAENPVINGTVMHANLGQVER